jgi:hypothetical protein
LARQLSKQSHISCPCQHHRLLCFPRISAGVAGVFGFLAEAFYFVSTSHVFGSNTSASSWEAFQLAKQWLITILSQRDNMTEKHKDLLNVLHWVKENCTRPELT